MIAIEGRTIWQVFAEAAGRWPANPVMMAPPEPDRPWHPDGVTLTYAEAAARASEIAGAFTAAGYGRGDRVALHLGNRPEHLVALLALNRLGVSAVPINPDLRPGEVAYILGDSRPALAICGPEHMDHMAASVAEAGIDMPVIELERVLAPPEGPGSEPGAGPETESCLLYTSGTTGRPKGCILSHEYVLSCGSWYAGLGGMVSLQTGKERLYNPLPLFHVNALVASLFAMIVTGGCQVQPARFSRERWWPDIAWADATIVHYLGVVAPVLMSTRPSPADRDHNVRIGVGAGIEPSLHGPMEKRFGFPLIEVWGMTEMCRVLAVNEEPRMVDTRAMGRPRPGLEVRVVDGEDRETKPEEPGEMTIRHSAETPRKGFFSGYLNHPDATETAWRGGWFHTGDMVVQDESGMVFFLDRLKNIIRRAGENIAAAEVEACLLGHEAVAQAAIVAVPDEVREEEVFACVTLREDAAPDERLARSIFDHALERMAYYKAPGWLLFVDELPVTGTQKVQKHALFPGEDPRRREGVHDFRSLKKRG